MAKLNQIVRSIIKKFDLFPTTQFLRYKSETDFKTATGGFISIAVIVILIILFYNLGTETVNKQIINGTVSYKVQVEPQPMIINMKKGSEFMFGVGIIGLDLNDPLVTYFNISLSQNFFSPLFKLTKSNNIPLVPCTLDHFSQSKDIKDLYYNFNASKYLCPSLNSQFAIGGKPTSQIYSQLQVKIQYCNKTINPKCLDQDILLYVQNYLIGGKFVVNIPIVNTLVNPGDEVYKQLYLQDRNYYYFTVDTDTGIELVGQIQQYQIDTDISLMPYAQIYTEYLVAAPNLFMVKPKRISQGTYVTVTFRKSSTSTVFTRSFNKIDNYFSYVGGLVGTILLFFFIIGSYSQNSFVISIASELYNFEEDHSSSPSKHFNFFYYFSLNFKKILEMIKVKCSWKSAQKFETIIEEMQKQLSITYLLQRINYLQEAITSILPQHQILTLCLKDKITLNEARNLRRRNNLSKKTLLDQEKQKQHQSKAASASNNNISSLNLKQNQLYQQSFVGSQQIPRQLRSSQAQESQNTQSQIQIQIKNKKEQIGNKLKASLAQVIHQSKQGNQISRRIIEKVSKKVFLETRVVVVGEKEKQKKQQMPVMNYDFNQQQQDKDKDQDYFEFQYIK